jgi:hypothetical protein
MFCGARCASYGSEPSLTTPGILSSQARDKIGIAKTKVNAQLSWSSNGFAAISVRCSTIAVVPESSNHRLQRVLDQLRLYEHPLLDFDAQVKDEGVEVIIQFKNPSIPVHTYHFELHPRDLDHPQFEWTFQRQLYDCLHDYLIEMFTRTPQNRAERQREGM